MDWGVGGLGWEWEWIGVLDVGWLGFGCGWIGVWMWVDWDGNMDGGLGAAAFSVQVSYLWGHQR